MTDSITETLWGDTAYYEPYPGVLLLSPDILAGCVTGGQLEFPFLAHYRLPEVPW